MVRRKKMTLFLNTLENVRVYKLKKMIEGKACVSQEIYRGIIKSFSWCITSYDYDLFTMNYMITLIKILSKLIYFTAILKVRPIDQQLYLIFKDNNYLDKYEQLSDSTACLSDYGLTSAAATVTYPAILGLAVRQKNGSFESLELTSYSVSKLSEFSFNGNSEDTEKCIAYVPPHGRYTEMIEKLTNTKLSSSFD